MISSIIIRRTCLSSNSPISWLINRILTSTFLVCSLSSRSFNLNSSWHVVTLLIIFLVSQKLLSVPIPFCHNFRLSFALTTTLLGFHVMFSIRNFEPIKLFAILLLQNIHSMLMLQLSKTSYTSNY